jgi:hypothetical protein
MESGSLMRLSGCHIERKKCAAAKIYERNFTSYRAQASTPAEAACA